jgi:hypothetical protein
MLACATGRAPLSAPVKSTRRHLAGRTGFEARRLAGFGPSNPFLAGDSGPGYEAARSRRTSPFAVRSVSVWAASQASNRSYGNGRLNRKP